MSQGNVNAVIHTVESAVGGIPVNAYVVETNNGAVVIDSTFTNPGADAILAKLELLSKPLLAVLLTHSHPDHYGGLTQLVSGAEVPIISSQGTAEAVKVVDETRGPAIKGAFGDIFPDTRTFPNETIDDGGSVTFDDVTFTLTNVGPAESQDDNYWTIDSLPNVAVIGDIVFSRTHGAMSDGTTNWLKVLDRLQADFADKTLLPGHGGATNVSMLNWQKTYIENFRKIVGEVADGRSETTEEEKGMIIQRFNEVADSNGQLEFNMVGSIDFVAAELAREGS